MLCIPKTVSCFLHDKESRNVFMAPVMVPVTGAGAYRYPGDWSWIDALHVFTFTRATICCGECSPGTDAGKRFAIFYVITGIGLIPSFIHAVYDCCNGLRKREGQGPAYVGRI